MRYSELERRLDVGAGPPLVNRPSVCLWAGHMFTRWPAGIYPELCVRCGERRDRGAVTYLRELGPGWREIVDVRLS